MKTKKLVDEAMVETWVALQTQTGKMSMYSTIRSKLSSFDGDGAAFVLPRLDFFPEGPPRKGPELELERTLGEGGMGRVYLARQRSLRREVVVKMALPSRERDGLKTRLLQESWVTGLMEHPNIVPVYQLGENPEGHPMLVMKRIEGVTWKDLLDPEVETPVFVEEAELSLDWHVQILLQVCHAIEFAHSKGIIHRDLKPENIMCGAFGEVYVLDWGLAISLNKEDRGFIPLAEEISSISGTPAYMAPEMLLFERWPTTERTDVYLLGAILFELLSGAPPHRGETLQEIFSQIAEGQARSYPAAASQDLVRICKRAMEQEPEERFESVKEFRLELQKYLRFRDSRKLSEKSSLLYQELCVQAGQVEDEESESLAMVHDLFLQCRFGFQQALEIWPENEDAGEGLRLLLIEMIGVELRCGDWKAASLLLTELEAPPAELVERMELLKSERSQEQERLEKLEQMAYESNFYVGAKVLRRAALALGFFWGLGPLLVFVLERVLQQTLMGHAQMFAINTAFGLFLAVAFYLGRRTLLQNKAGRQMAKLLVLFLLFFPLQRVGVIILGIPFPQTLILELAFFFAFLSILSIFIESRMRYAAGIYLVSFFVCAYLPVYLYLISSVAHFSAMLVVAWCWEPGFLFGEQAGARQSG